MAQHKKNELEKKTWGEYCVTMEKLYKQINSYIKKNNITIDAIVPILRGGGFLGIYLAYKLNSLRVLPIQYKYFFTGDNNAELRRILFTPKKNMFSNDNPTFLTVEGDQCFGNTVMKTIQDLKRMFPKCKIVHVADCLDYTYKDSVKKDVLKIFYGEYTNHCDGLSKEQCKKLGIGKSVMAPWESAEEELAVLNGKKFKYVNDEQIQKQSIKKAKFKFDFNKNTEKWTVKEE